MSPKLLPRVAVAAVAAPLLAHAYVRLYSRYWYDDFNTAAVLRDRGFFGSQRYWYANWSGRFSFYFAVNLAESAGSWVVSLLPLAALSYFFEQHTRRWRGTALLCFALPACLALSAGASRLSQSAGAPPETPGARRLLKLLAYGTAAGFALIVLCFIPGFYAQSETLPRRAHIVPKFVLVCLNVYWGALAGLALLRAMRGRKALSLTLPAGWCAVAALLVVSAAASARRTFALGARARAYAESWDEAERQIRAAAAAGARDVTVRAVEGEDWELGFGRPELRLSRDPKAPQNVAAAVYYGLDSVKAE